MEALRRLTKDELNAMINLCKEEMFNNCQMPSEHLSGDFLTGKNYAYKEMVMMCENRLKEF